ncbi:hypothetical protein PCASD_25304, partial [Puccinia coronata f. sp. avenae]
FFLRIDKQPTTSNSRFRTSAILNQPSIVFYLLIHPNTRRELIEVSSGGATKLTSGGLFNFTIPIRSTNINFTVLVRIEF